MLTNAEMCKAKKIFDKKQILNPKFTFITKFQHILQVFGKGTVFYNIPITYIIGILNNFMCLSVNT